MTKKNYFTIFEIAKEFKVKRSQIRSYEKNGLISRGNDKLGRRLYNQFDRARLELIFHFEHIDYSPDQISGLIGILDVNLNKMEQFRNSLEYGEKKLDELEKQSKKIKFPDRISAINEMNIMRNYIEKLKNIEPLESATEITLKQKHIRIIPVFVGLSIIILFISGYFFYHGGIILNLAQKKPSMLEASPLYRYPVPTDDTVDQQNGDPQPSVIPDSPVPIQEGDSFTKESKELFHKEVILDKSEAVILSEIAPNTTVEKVPLLSTKSKDAIIEVEGSESSPDQKSLEVLQEMALLEENESVKKGQEANLTQRTESLPVLKAGLSVIGTKPTVLTKPCDSQLESKKLIDKKHSGIGETGRHENEDIAVKLNQLDSKDTQLSPLSIAPDKKTN